MQPQCIVGYLSRLRDAAMNMTEDFILMLEDDVSVRGPIEGLRYDLNGVDPSSGGLGYAATRVLRALNPRIGVNNHGYGGCGDKNELPV